MSKISVMVSRIVSGEFAGSSVERGQQIMPRTARAALFALLAVPAAGLHAQRPGAFLGDLTWPEAEARLAEAPLVIVPFGAGAKEHGPHLPLNADRVVMEYLCRQAVDSMPVLVAPPIVHGWFPAFRDFPGTEVRDPSVFLDYVLEVAQSLVRHGAKRIVFLNTGIARATGLPIAMAAREIRVQTGVPTLVVSWDDLETPEYRALQDVPGGGHAGELETSIHLYLQRELVHMDRAVAPEGEPEPQEYPGYRPGLLSRDRRDPAFSTSGVSGEPTMASADKGERALAIMTNRWLVALRGFSAAPLRAPE
ncbi:MAG: creatininase family protein [Gemmatimonadales bacterium]